MNKIATQIPRLCARQVLSATRAFSVTPQRMDAGPERVSLEAVKAKQRQYQLDDGIPVFLKGGMSDRILFGTTCLLCVVGLGYSVKIIYEMSVPPKN